MRRQLSFAEKIRDVPGMVRATPHPRRTGAVAARSRRALSLIASLAQMIAGKQVAFDVFIHLPFIYYPSFYLVKEAVQGGARCVFVGFRRRLSVAVDAIDAPGRSPDAIIAGGFAKYTTNFVKTPASPPLERRVRARGRAAPPGRPRHRARVGARPDRHVQNLGAGRHHHLFRLSTQRHQGGAALSPLRAGRRTRSP
jgi:hypothetical protein